MEKMSPQPKRSPSTIPLARDPDGNAIDLPDGVVGWRIRRQTGGRPRLRQSRELMLVGHALAIAAEAGQIFRPSGTHSSVSGES